MKSKFDFNNTKIDWEKVDRVIEGSNKILLTTHENPDGDGLGSQLAFFYYLIPEVIPLQKNHYKGLPLSFHFYHCKLYFQSQFQS